MKYLFFIIVVSIASSFGLVNESFEKENSYPHVPVEQIEFTEPMYITVGL